VAEPAAPRRRGRLVAIAAVVVAALLGTAAYLWSQSSQTRQAGPTAPSSAATSSAATPSAAELGVSKPLTTPACDGTYVVIVGSAVNPAAYTTEVQRFLDLNPGSKYLHAPTTGCTSLRPELNGAEIYSVFYGPYKEKDAACGQQAAVGGDSFVRRLDKSSSWDRPSAATEGPLAPQRFQYRNARTPVSVQAWANRPSRTVKKSTPPTVPFAPDWADQRNATRPWARSTTGRR
jgi:serine/threonine-protein kinase